MNNKKSVMQKIVIAISALVIIACSITTISLAWFTDTKIGTTVLQFGKIEIDDENTFGGPEASIFNAKNLLASMELNTEDLLIDLTNDSNDAFVRARFEIGLPLFNEAPDYDPIEEGSDEYEITNGAYVVETMPLEKVEEINEALPAVEKVLEEGQPATELYNAVYENMKDKVTAILEEGHPDIELYARKAYNAYIDWVIAEVVADLEEEGGRPEREAYITDEEGNVLSYANPIAYKFVPSGIEGDPNYYLVDAEGKPLAAKQMVKTIEFRDVTAEEVTAATPIPADKIVVRDGAQVTEGTLATGDKISVSVMEGYVFATAGTFKVRNTANQIPPMKLEKYEATADANAIENEKYFSLNEETGEYTALNLEEGAAVPAGSYKLVDTGAVLEYAQYNCELACVLTAEAMQTSVVAEQDICMGAAETYDAITTDQTDATVMVKSGTKYLVGAEGDDEELSVQIFAAMLKIAFEE